MQDFFLWFYTAYYIHVDFVVLTKLLFTLIYTEYIYTGIYNRPLYMYINVCTYTWPHWKLLHLLCSRAGYGPSGTLSWHFSCGAVNNKVYINVFVITLETPKIHTKGQRYKIRNTWSYNKDVHIMQIMCTHFIFFLWLCTNSGTNLWTC